MNQNLPAKYTISRWDLFKVFIASFFMQSVWNYRSLISIGFSTCLLPVINKLYHDPEKRRDFVKRHLQFFNAHPYFASYALGVSIRLEELSADGAKDVQEKVERMKDLLISPLGAVGDRLFWATIKPATLVFGMAGYLLAPNLFTGLLVLGLTFLMYNIPHFYIRYRGIQLGYKHGLEIYKYVNQGKFERIRRYYLALLILSVAVVTTSYSIKVFHISALLPLLIFSTTAMAAGLNRLTGNFYLVCFTAFSFFVAIGLLFF